MTADPRSRVRTNGAPEQQKPLNTCYNLLAPDHAEWQIERPRWVPLLRPDLARDRGASLMCPEKNRRRRFYFPPSLRERWQIGRRGFFPERAFSFSFYIKSNCSDGERWAPTATGGKNVCINMRCAFRDGGRINWPGDDPLQKWFRKYEGLFDRNRKMYCFSIPSVVIKLTLKNLYLLMPLELSYFAIFLCRYTLCFLFMYARGSKMGGCIATCDVHFVTEKWFIGWGRFAGGFIKMVSYEGLLD